MSNIKAIIIQGGKEAKVQTVAAPRLRDEYLLVRVKAVALNPTDWKSVYANLGVGGRLGCDFAGVVEAIGDKVTKDFKVGDRVAGFVSGGNELELEDGAFAEVIAAKSNLTIKIPDNLSFEEASTLGVGITTVGQGLYQSLRLPLPTSPAKEPTPILIYGGSTATGALAIQFAKLSGFTVITTASPSNFETLKSLGADAVFDYKSPTCVEDIKAFTKNSLSHVFDCITEHGSIEICVSAMSPNGGIYSTLLRASKDKVEAINPNVKFQATLAYTATGEKIFSRGFSEGRYKEGSQEDAEFAAQFWELSKDLLAEGKVKVHHPSINEGGKSGFEGILHGLNLLKEGKVSGRKLVYTF